MTAKSKAKKPNAVDMVRHCENCNAMGWYIAKSSKTDYFRQKECECCKGKGIVLKEEVK